MQQIDRTGQHRCDHHRHPDPSIRTLLDKRGGYLSNDKLPPGVFMDNLPNWEFGSLTASRDLVRALRNDFSRSQTQSTEDKDLAEADPLLNSPNDRWLLPSSESQYRKAVKHLDGYLMRLGDAEDAQRAFLRARRQSGRLPAACLVAAGLAVAAAVGQCGPDSRRRRWTGPASAGQRAAARRMGAW